MKVKSKARAPAAKRVTGPDNKKSAVKKTSAKKPAAAKTGQAATPKKRICANEKRAYDHGRRHGYKAEKERQTVRGTYPKATEKLSFDAGNTVGVACCRIEKAAAIVERAAAKIEKKAKIKEN